jgi:heptaprenyl diphosphate synthase
MKTTKKLTLFANLLAIAIVLNIIESAIAIVPVPGAKLGFANVVTLIVLYLYSPRDSVILVLLRVFLVGLLSGRLLSPVFYMSLSGGVFATLSMIVMYRLKSFSLTSVSVVGSIMHTIGQIVMGIFVIGSVAVVSYLPIMLVLSIPAGVVTGIISSRFLSAISSYSQNLV